MPLSPPYNPVTSFANDETNQVSGRSTVRTVALDTELANAASSINALKTNIERLQRDDGKLKDFIVEPYALAEQTRALLAAGGKPRGIWASGTMYAVGDSIQQNAIAYICYTAHLSAAPFTANGFWIAISGDGSAAASAASAAASQTAAFFNEQASAASATASAASATASSASATASGNSATSATNSATASAVSAVAALTSENASADSEIASASSASAAADSAASAAASAASSDALVLRNDLANTVDALKGSTLIGFIGFGGVLAKVSQLSSSIGSSLLGWLQAGVGAIQRSVQDKLRDTVSVRDFGALGDGSDATVAIQKCADYLLDRGFEGGTIHFPHGVYLVTGTIYISAKIHLRGAGVESTIILRNTDYGDTFVFGDPADAEKKALANRVSDMFLMHDHQYSELGGVALINRVTTDSVHLRFWGPQRVLVENCLLWHLRGQIAMHGGSVNRVINCDTYGVWDHANVDMQECDYSIGVFNNTVHGFPKDYVVSGNSVYGLNSAPRSVSFGGYGSRTYGESIGPRNGFFTDALETLVLSDNYFGQCNVAGVSVAASSFVINWRIANNFFDESRLFDILFAGVSGNYSLGVTIVGNTFNGQGDGQTAIFVSDPGSAIPVVSMLTIANNVFLSYSKTPINLGGAWGVTVTGNVVSNYNTKMLSELDGSIASACFVFGSSKNILFNSNTVGGGGNSYDLNPAVNGCKYGIYKFGAGVSNVLQFNNLDAGLRAGGAMEV